MTNVKSCYASWDYQSSKLHLKRKHNARFLSKPASHLQLVIVFLRSLISIDKLISGSEDMDSLTFGTPILLRRLNLAESQQKPIMEIYLDKVPSRANLLCAYDMLTLV